MPLWSSIHSDEQPPPISDGVITSSPIPITGSRNISSMSYGSTSGTTSTHINTGEDGLLLPLAQTSQPSRGLKMLPPGHFKLIATRSKQLMEYIGINENPFPSAEEMSSNIDRVWAQACVQLGHIPEDMIMPAAASQYVS